MQAGVGAVIVSVVFDMMQGMLALKDPISIVIMVAAFIANYCFNMNVVYIVLLCALYGVLRTIYKTRRKAV